MEPFFIAECLPELPHGGIGSRDLPVFQASAIRARANV
jgi:hypothetical protein